MQKLRNRYREEKLQAENRIAGLCQGKDGVRDFAARLQVAANALYPSHPGKLKVLMHENGATTIPNPTITEDMLDYNRMVEKAESSLMKVFMSGLRPDIQARLPSEIYTTFEQMVDGARKAEWIQGGISAGMLNKCTNHLYSLEGETNEQVHALISKKKEWRDSSDNKQLSQGKFDGFCWGCGEKGHSKRNCQKKPFELNQSNAGQGWGRSQGATANPRPMRGRGGFRGGRNYNNVASGNRNSTFKRGNRRQLPSRLRNHLRFPSYNGPRRNIRDNNTRRWMVKSRARFNTRRRLEGSLYQLEGEQEPEYTEEEFDDEEKELFLLEDQMSNEEFQAYEEEVGQEEEQLDADIEQLQSKN
jgi:hypothetical protein